jgi:hypothetical protein
MRPYQIRPHLETLAQQVNGIINYYRQMLDDEFMFNAGMQMPQVATIFDRVGNQPLLFQDEMLSLVDILTLIAYRYGFETVQRIGHGGYAIVLGHKVHPEIAREQRRVLRLVPEHHVRNILHQAQDPPRDFDVRLDENNDPIRDRKYPLLLSDLFLMPRHTTKLTFCDENGDVIQAGGYPAHLHCQLLPEVYPFTSSHLNVQQARSAGNMLEVALATLGVSVADAHGGNGGALVGRDGQPLMYTVSPTEQHYIPVVLDYGYYSRIGVRKLTTILVENGITREQVRAMLIHHGSDFQLGRSESWVVDLAEAIDESDLPRRAFGRLLYHAHVTVLNPSMWINRAEYHWRTIKETFYPALQAQSRLAQLYPDYDEVVFPQRVEEYTFTLRSS